MAVESILSAAFEWLEWGELKCAKALRLFWVSLAGWFIKTSYQGEQLQKEKLSFAEEREITRKD